MDQLSGKTLTDFARDYRNTGDHNDDLFELFTNAANELDFLREHRDYIEQHQLGFGDRAFHYLWYLVISHLFTQSGAKRVLEIGVYKGQVVSLWALIAGKLNRQLSITGITPLKGNELPGKFKLFVKRKLSRAFRENITNGNFYGETDYRRVIQDLFLHFHLDINDLELIQGFSTDSGVIKRAGEQIYAVVYIDGDHSYNGVRHDIQTYAPLIEPGGLLIMDDASFDLPGTKFWKGYQDVSRACEAIDPRYFDNILNIGHNRVYQKRITQL